VLKIANSSVQFAQKNPGQKVTSLPIATCAAAKAKKQLFTQLLPYICMTPSKAIFNKKFLKKAFFALWVSSFQLWSFLPNPAIRKAKNSY